MVSGKSLFAILAATALCVPVFAGSECCPGKDKADKGGAAAAEAKAGGAKAEKAAKFDKALKADKEKYAAKKADKAAKAEKGGAAAAEAKAGGADKAASCGDKAECADKKAPEGGAAAESKAGGADKAGCGDKGSCADKAADGGAGAADAAAGGADKAGCGDKGSCGDKAAPKGGADDSEAAKAPAIEAKDIDGNDFKLEDHKGKVVVIEWYNPECPFVKKHYTDDVKTMIDTAKKFEDVAWVRIATGNTADVDKLKAAREKAGYEGIIVLDEDGSIGKAYGAKTTPHMFIIDTEGKIAYQGAIDDNKGTDAKPDAKNFVAAALEKVTAGEKPEVAKTDPYGCSVKYKN